MMVNEENYIKLLKEKNEDALYFVVDKYHPLVKGITFKVLSPLNRDGIIDECINDIYMQIWNNAKKFSGELADFKKWVGAIAKFKAIDYYRSYIKDIKTSLDEITERGGLPLEEEIISLENRTELIKEINLLGKPDSEIFLMKYFLGYRSEEIGKMLDLSKASVDNRLSRGRKKLKMSLSNIREVM